MLDRAGARGGTSRFIVAIEEVSASVVYPRIAVIRHPRPMIPMTWVKP